MRPRRAVAASTAALVAVAGAGAAAAGAGGGVPAGARQASAGPAPLLAFDRACYVSGQAGVVRLGGFTPGVAVVVAGAGLGEVRVVPGAAGSARVPLTPPPSGDPGVPGSRAFEVTAQQEGVPVVVARAVARVAPRAFRSSDGTQAPGVQRTWAFSGWRPGAAIHAHFRFAGRTRGSFRFGVAAGPCGELIAPGPALVSPRGLPYGRWTIQVDQRPDYSPVAAPALRTRTVVFPQFRRAATPRRRAP